MSRTFDTNDGHYNWRPNLDEQAALRTLLESMTASGASGEVRLTITNPGESNADITGYGASKGAGNMEVLTLNLNELTRQTAPLTSITVSGTLVDTTSWTLTRVDHAGVVTIVATGTAATSMRYVEFLSPTLKPPASGWVYNLRARNSALGDCGDAHATCRVRVIQPAALTLTADAPGGLSGPFVNQQAAYLNLTGTDGDPPGTQWFLDQSAPGGGLTNRVIQHLPAISAATLGTTGTARPRLQVAGGGGGATRVRASWVGEAGRVDTPWQTIRWLT